MTFLDGIQNFLQALNDNWTNILVCVGLTIGVAQKTMAYAKKTDAEKASIAKRQIQEIMLKMISDAEVEYSETKKAGQIKRSEVFSKIFAEYPILNKVVEQDELVEWIDNEIDRALVTLKDTAVKEDK